MNSKFEYEDLIIKKDLINEKTPINIILYEGHVDHMESDSIYQTYYELFVNNQIITTFHIINLTSEMTMKDLIWLA